MADEVAHIDLNCAEEGAQEGRPTQTIDHHRSSVLPNSNTHPVLQKTFRSELNLVFIAHPSPIGPVLVPHTAAAAAAVGISRLTPADELGGCSSDLTPPPNLPEPMNLLPATLPYLDFKSNTAIITTPKAAMANRSNPPADNGAGGGAAAAATTVTSVVSKPICSATAVRKKLFGKKNKEAVINEPERDWKAPVVPLKLTIPSVATGADLKAMSTDDRVYEPPVDSKVKGLGATSTVRRPLLS